MRSKEPMNWVSQPHDCSNLGSQVPTSWITLTGVNTPQALPSARVGWSILGVTIPQLNSSIREFQQPMNCSCWNSSKVWLKHVNTLSYLRNFRLWDDFDPTLFTIPRCSVVQVTKWVVGATQSVAQLGLQEAAPHINQEVVDSRLLRLMAWCMPFVSLYHRDGQRAVYWRSWLIFSR